MKQLLTITDQSLGINSPTRQQNEYKTRQAARAILLDENNRVALLHVGLQDYYKLPGGGIDEGESVMSALHREIAEETGCLAKVIGEIGEVLEYRDQIQLEQVSYCFLMKVTDSSGQPGFTEKELSEGFQLEWADNISHAIELIEQSKAQDYESIFMRRRDVAILEEVKQLNSPK